MTNEQKAIRAMVQAFRELNTIRARDGVPYTHMGMKACVCQEYFSQVVDDLDEAVKLLSGQGAHCHPALYEKLPGPDLPPKEAGGDPFHNYDYSP